MRAMVIHRHGGPEVLTYEPKWPDPVAGPGEMVVRVHACALNPLDIFTREGMPAHVTWAMMYSRSHLGGDETSYTIGSHTRSRPPASGDGQPPTPEEIAAREEITDAWIRTLPGQKGWNAPPPPLGFSLTTS